MLSRRAEEACRIVDRYPCGDAGDWARRNWTQSVLPYMEEFATAVERRSSGVPEEYFNESSPLFLFIDGKAMFAMAESMRNMPAQKKATVINEVFVPYGDKWQELLGALQKKIGACAEMRSFRTKLVQVADTVKLMFVEREFASHMDAIWDLRSGMIEAFERLRAKVCAATASARAPKTRQRYCLPNAELARLFGVSVKTIVRWKDERNQSEDARRFRSARESERAMYEAVRMYKSAHAMRSCRRSIESFNEQVDYSSRRLGRL